MNRAVRGGLLAACLLASLPGVGQTTKFTIQRFEISGNSLLPAETADAAVAAFTGEGRSLTDINQAAEALHKAYTDAGYPVVHVYPPEQTAPGGVVTLRVIEGKVVKVIVAGNAAYDEANIRASLPALKEGTAPRTSDVVANIVLANENPAKQVAVNFQAGTTPGEVNARVDVTEDRIEKYTATVDNAGTAGTNNSGFNRLSLGYQNANLGNRDHMLTVALNTTVEHPDKNLNLVAGYRIPFYEHGLSLDLIGSYSDSRTVTNMPAGGSMYFAGRGSYVGGRLNQALTSVGEYRHKIVYGLDYKDFANQVLIGNVVSPNNNTVTAVPASLAYIAQMATPAYQVGGNLTYVFNIPGGLHGGELDYNAARTGAPRAWDAWRGSAFLAVPLPDDWQFRVNASLQETGKLLVSSEQFGLGGAGTVRGYGERAVAGDTGYSANVEFYTPDFGKLLGERFKSRLVFFLDQGRVANNGTTTSHPVDLQSVGVGIRLNYGKEITAKADLGFSQTPNAYQTLPSSPVPTMPARETWGLKPAGDHWGLHLSASYVF